MCSSPCLCLDLEENPFFDINKFGWWMDTYDLYILEK